MDYISFLRIYDDTGGFVTNTTGVICDLTKTGVQDFGVFGKDRISKFENIDGSDGADRFFGTGGANYISGRDGNDWLKGRAGADELYGGDDDDRLLGDGGADTLFGDNENDRLFGGADRDSLYGGDGIDSLTGGSGADEFDLSESGVARDTVIYTRITDSGAGFGASTLDVIYGFDAGGLATDDKISLSAIDARPNQAGNQAFVFRGLDPFSSPGGEVRLEEGGGNTLVMVDIDGDGASEMNILVMGVTGLTADDFIL